MLGRLRLSWNKKAGVLTIDADLPYDPDQRRHPEPKLPIELTRDQAIELMLFIFDEIE